MNTGKSMKLSEFQTLKKLLSLTVSTSDGEALTALRKANDILTRNKLLWVDVLDKLVTVDAVEVAPADPSEDALNQAIDDAFDYLRGRELGKMGGFIESIEKQWKSKHYLSINQRRPLFETLKFAKSND